MKDKVKLQRVALHVTSVRIDIFDKQMTEKS